MKFTQSHWSDISAIARWVFTFNVFITRKWFFLATNTTNKKTINEKRNKWKDFITICTHSLRCRDRLCMVSWRLDARDFHKRYLLVVSSHAKHTWVDDIFHLVDHTQPCTGERNTSKSFWIVVLAQRFVCRLTSDHTLTSHTALHLSLKHSCRRTGLSSSLHRALSTVWLLNQHTTCRCWMALFRLMHLDFAHNVQFVVAQCGHSIDPHLSIVSGTDNPASSHSSLFTLNVALSSRTIQWAVRDFRRKYFLFE